MERKRVRLAMLPSNSDHAYRLHANMGTFLAHDWIRRTDHLDPSEMKLARDEIAEAVRINPQAHFGRERVQLAIMEWMLDPTHFVSAGEDPVKGLAGLVALGAAWESVDVFDALAHALRGQSAAVLGYLASKRRDELLASGHPWMNAAGPLHKGILGSDLEYSIHPVRKASLDVWFSQARAAADAWQAERASYMDARLRAGRHPDWDPHFWDEFVPSPSTRMPSMGRVDWEAHKAGAWKVEDVALVCLVVCCGMLVYVIARAIGGRAARRRTRS
jgi:hypothetical protein